VADLAWEIVKAEETEETLPLLHAVAQSPRSSHRTSAIERIAAFASPRSIPVLTALLDDDLLSIRSGALAALEEIERVAAERRKWQERKAEGRR
jgi:HEAT repeat protein